MTRAVPDTPIGLAALPARIVFFDGVCVLCDASVRWLRSRDAAASLHFAPLQGETAAIVRGAFAERFPTDVDTIVYLRPDERGLPEISLRSAAIFELLREIGGGWAWLAAFRILPTRLTDLGYRIFARSRYRVFGKLDVCELPAPEDRARSLP